MYLKELSLNGFKSFARKSELEFSASITAIVGPNGSGKSNVAESFRFVLGEQSVKAMRGKKGEDLIWGGSEKVSRGNRANVEVVFDNTQRTFALDFDEVKIERIVHRDGQNEYKLNDSVVRLKDIHELLASANIGATGHHIISQGEADRILAAGGKERREMIEDALGLKIYQLKKQESERKLEKTLENIAQVESLRREAAPHLKYLKKQVERAERSLQVQAQLRTTYAEYLKREDVYIAHHHDRLSKNRREPEIVLTKIRHQLEALEAKLTGDQRSVSREEIATLEAAVKSATSEKYTVERSLNMVQGQISLLEERLAARTEESVDTAGVIAKSKVHDVARHLEEALTQFEHSKDVGTFLSAVKSFLKSLHSALSNHGHDTTVDDKREIERLKNDRDRLQHEVTAAERAMQVADEKYRNTLAEKDAKVNESQTAERELFSLREQQGETELTLRTIDSELSVLERDRDEFKRELQEAVSLLGRGATEYFTAVFNTADGVVVTDEMIVNESRDVQFGRRRDLEKLKIRLEELGVGATEDLLKEHKDAEERDAFLAHELSDLDASVQNLRTLIAELEDKLREQFTTGIEKISLEFNRFFTLMFGGGEASLVQVEIPVRGNEEDTDEEPKTALGVEIKVTLPNKRVKGLEMLSGGERALTSIAVIFAMSQVNPPPFIILDETDAALDEANSRRYGDMIEELAKKSQLVLITHNRETMSRAGILYGITMGSDGVSKILSVKFDEAASVAK